MKRAVCLLFILILGVLLVSCSTQGKLTRVDVQIVNEEGKYEDVGTITDPQRLDVINRSMNKVKWQPRTLAEMVRYEDIFATFFYTVDENMPGRIYEYRIWFNVNSTSTIISSNENESFGSLDEENTQILKDLLLQK